MSHALALLPLSLLSLAACAVAPGTMPPPIDPDGGVVDPMRGDATTTVDSAVVSVSDAALPDAGMEEIDAGPSMMVEPEIVPAVDVSIWSGTLTDAHVDCLWTEGYRHVIAGTQLPWVTREQLAVAVRGGMTVDLYVYVYWHESIAAQIDEALEIARDYPEVGRIWVDVEEAPAGRSPAALAALVAAALTRLGDFPGGIYTSSGFWQSYMDDTIEFADVPLWYARYDGRATLDAWDDPARPDRFGGWVEPWGKQYADHHVHTCGLPMDRNVMWSDIAPTVELDRATPPDDGTPPPAPTDLRPNGIEVTTENLRPTAPTIREATGYVIELEYETASGFRPYITLERAVSSAEIYPVYDDIRYRFRMKARNAHGDSPWSEWAVVTFRPF
jgi:hypothetical protein